MNKKILFINFGGLGDEILFLPTIMSVRQEFPNSEITLALEPRSKAITQLTDVIDNIITADIKNSNKFIELLKLLWIIYSKRFDIVISSGSNKFISIFLFLTFIPKRIGYYTGKLSKILLSDAVDLNKNQYAVNMYHDLIRSITNYKTYLPKIIVKRTSVEPNTVLIHPGVSLLSIRKGMIKTVPATVWAEVIEKLADNGKKVILAGGPDDEEVIMHIQSTIPNSKYTNMYGKTKNLKELAEIIAKTELFLCSDSAPLHIAVALGVKTYVIFGSTDDKKLIPQNGNVIAIKAACDCSLMPCLWERRQTTCKSLDCLKISADDIVKKILN